MVVKSGEVSNLLVSTGRDRVQDHCLLACFVVCLLSIESMVELRWQIEFSKVEVPAIVIGTRPLLRWLSIVFPSGTTKYLFRTSRYEKILCSDRTAIIVSELIHTSIVLARNDPIEGHVVTRSRTVGFHRSYMLLLDMKTLGDYRMISKKYDSWPQAKSSRAFDRRLALDSSRL